MMISLVKSRWRGGDLPYCSGLVPLMGLLLSMGCALDRYREVTAARADGDSPALILSTLPAAEGAANGARLPPHLLTGPFAVARANFFHASLEVPPLQAARTLPRGSLALRLRSTHARSNAERHLDGIKNDFDGTYHEWAAIEASWGALDRLELAVGAVIAGWDEHQDRFRLFDAGGTPIVRFEERDIFGIGASKRHENMSVVRLAAKGALPRGALARLDLALLASVKIPVGRDRDLTHAGTVDPAVTLIASAPTRWGAAHLNIGATAPLGSQNLFIPGARIDLDPFLHGGAGIVWRLTETISTGIQVEAQTSAFGDLRFLDEAPVNLLAGLRRARGNLIMEIAAGAGLGWRSSYQWLGSGSIGLVF